MILRQMVRAVAANFGSKTAELAYDRPMTFAEVDSRVNSFANALLSLGLKKGDRVGILSHNCPQYREVYFAGIKADVALLTLNYRLKESELAYIVNDCKPTAIVAGEEQVPVAEALAKQYPFIKHIISLGGNAKLCYEDLISKYPSTEPKVDIAEDDLALIMYTSGTTGKPKGAVITQKNWCSMVRTGIYNTASAYPDTVYLSTWPLAGSAGCLNDLRHYLSGATMLLRDQFDAEVALKDIAQYRVTCINMVPTALKYLIEHPDYPKTDMSSLKVVSFSGGIMPPALLTRLQELLPGRDFQQIYGSTETGPMTMLTREDYARHDAKGLERLKSVGRALPGYSIRTVDDDDKDLPARGEGEIIVKSDSVFKGYWGLEQASALAFKDGWYHTGDLAMLDEDGYLFLLGRKDYMIKTGGYNVYPAEVENVIAAHPSVLEVAVLGLPHPDYGLAVSAFVVLKPGTKATDTEIIQLCKEKLAGYKKPQSVLFVDSFPKTAMGKVIKKDIIEQYLAKKAAG